MLRLKAVGQDMAVPRPDLAYTTPCRAEPLLYWIEVFERESVCKVKCNLPGRNLSFTVFAHKKRTSLAATVGLIIWEQPGEMLRDNSYYGMTSLTFAFMTL